MEGWALGTPDLVLEMGEDFTVPASGPDLYRCFVIPTNLRRDAFISAVEFQPGNRRVVHHFMAFLDTSGAGRLRDDLDPGPGYTSYSGPGVEVEGDLGGWAAGNTPAYLPEGIGRPVPAFSDVILQVHYHPSGKPEVDRSRLAIYFCKKPVKQTLHWANATNSTFRLLPGKPDNEVKATWNVPVDVEALGVTPHMHQLGRDFRMSVTFPGGRTQDLLHIDSWDPSWQNTYYFEKTRLLAQGVDRQGHCPLRQLRPSPQPAQPAASSSSGDRKSPTRCWSATSASSRRARTSPGPARRTTSSRS